VRPIALSTGAAPPGLAGAMWGFHAPGSEGRFDKRFNEAKEQFWDRLRSFAMENGGKYLWVTERAASESEDHFLLKAFVVKLLATRKGIESASAGEMRSRILTEYRDAISGEVYDVYDGGEGIAYEIETLYGEGPFPLKKLQRTAEKRPRVRVVLDPFCASLHLKEVMDLRRQLTSEGKDVEFYAATAEEKGSLIEVTGLSKRINDYEG